MELRLKEQKNTVQIVGELKSINLNWGRKDKNGREFVSGNLVVRITNENGIGEQSKQSLCYSSLGRQKEDRILTNQRKDEADKKL